MQMWGEHSLLQRSKNIFDKGITTTRKSVMFILYLYSYYLPLYTYYTFTLFLVSGL